MRISLMLTDTKTEHLGILEEWNIERKCTFLVCLQYAKDFTNLYANHLIREVFELNYKNI